MKNYLKKSANFASWKELFSKKCEFHCEFERIIRESCQNSANEFCLDLYVRRRRPCFIEGHIIYYICINCYMIYIWWRGGRGNWRRSRLSGLIVSKLQLAWVWQHGSEWHCEFHFHCEFEELFSITASFHCEWGRIILKKSACFWLRIYKNSSVSDVCVCVLYCVVSCLVVCCCLSVCLPVCITPPYNTAV